MTETKDPTLAERIEKAGLKMSATSIQTNPPAWARMMDGWRCTFRMDGRSFTMTFWMGPGHQGRRPTAEEVMECVLSDAAIRENTSGAWELMEEFGYESGREAERVWQAIVGQTTRLKRFLGDQYAAWVWETER